jgi:hypothetical protein
MRSATALILVLLLTSLTACTAPSSPMTLHLDVNGEPIVEKSVDLLVTITTQSTAENIEFSLTLSPGLKLEDGSPTWKGEMADGESISLHFTVQVIEEGDWPVAAYAFNAYSTDSTHGFGAGETVYLVSRMNSGEVLRESEYRGTPSSPAINWSDWEGTLPPELTE